MATAVQNNVACDIAETNAPSISDTSQIDFHVRRIDTMNDEPSTGDATEKSQSEKIVERTEPSTCSGRTAENQRSNDNENHSLDDAPKKRIVGKKHKHFPDNDSEEEDDTITSILGKSKSSQEMQSSLDRTDENIAETLSTNAAKSKSIARLIDSDSDNDEPSMGAATEKSQSEKIVERTEPSTCSGRTAENQRSNDNENDSLDDAPKKRIVGKKHKHFPDNDSEEEDDTITSILGKSKSSQEMQSSLDRTDENVMETLRVNAGKSRSIARLIDSDSDNDEPSMGAATEKSQSEKIVERTEPSTCSGRTAENQRSNDNENDLLDDAPKKRIVGKKHRHFPDNDSEEEDDTITSILGKSKSSQEMQSSSDRTDENNMETLRANAGKSRSIARLIDSDSDDDEPSMGDATEKSQSEKIVERTEPSTCSGRTAENQRSNDNENDLLDDAPKKRIVEKKYRHFLDSDSEEEDDTITSILGKSKSSQEMQSSLDRTDENVMETLSANAGKSRSIARLIDSDSDNDDVVDKPEIAGTCDDDDNSIYTVKKRINALVDSESEDNDLSKNSVQSSPTQDRRKVTSERKKNRKVEKTAKKSKLSSLIDTDSEDEENNVDKSRINEQDDTELASKKNAKSTKKRTGSQRASKDEAMRKIHSETQRLIRSSEVSLPYHRPKQRSLQDFLNRKKLIPALPEGLTTAAKVKMSSEIVSKVLEEKAKEAELFYKSSDSEDETICCKPANVVEARESSSTCVEEIAIEETEKIIKTDVQNAHNKKEIIKQGAIDIGVSRKLFVENVKESAKIDETPRIDADDEESVESEDPRRKPKTIKQGLKQTSVSRKLFSSDYDEGVESQSKICDVPLLVTKKTVDSESSEITDGQSESVDEGIDSLSQNGEFSDQNPICEESRQTIEPKECNKSTQVLDETPKIFDTQFFSNKDVEKLNEEGKAQSGQLDFSEMDIDENDASDPRTVIGHVFGLPPPDMDDNCPKITEDHNVKNKALSTVSNVCPRLRGAPGMVIDLSDEVKPNRDGVKSLLDRFYRHSVVNKPAEVSKTVTVLHTERTADGLHVVEQVIPYKLPAHDLLSDKELSKPGAKHLRLKSELIERMAKKRGEEWKLKEKQQKEDDEEEEEEEEDCDDDDIEDEYDSEADSKLIEEEISGSGESEPEEDDMPKSKKRKKPSEFVDDEAEVSGEEENNEEMQAGGDDDEENEDEDREENASRDIDDDDAENADKLSDADAEVDTAKKRKRASRIAKAFEDDSNSLPDVSSQSEVASPEKKFQRTRTDVDMFELEDNNEAWLSDSEADFPPSQVLPCGQADARSQACKTPLTAINVLRFVSPMTQLTALNSFANSPRDSSATKSHPSPGQRAAALSTETTPANKGTAVSCYSENRTGFQKKLFQEPTGMVNDEELMDLCSGRFTGIETDNGAALSVASHDKLSASSQASQLFGLSVGSFFSKAIDTEAVEKTTKPDVDETSQDIRLTLDDDEEISRDKAVSKETGCEAAARTKYSVVSSSDDEDEIALSTAENKSIRKKRKKVKQLELSDDEDEAEWSNEDEEEECKLSCDDNEDKYVDYDSEENEVVIVPKKDIKKVAANFLDDEAELSESEWGSADEDEKGLDKLELEEGDEEEIDENQMRDQLGKMHVRQILDDDQRDVRMLQELLFEDGDLHTDGSGRERKFKWKNIDKLGEDGNNGPVTGDGEANGDQLEEENDLEWRKLRLERDKFLQEKMKIPSDEIHDELTPESTIFKLGMRALKKTKSSQCAQKESDDSVLKKPLVPRTVMDFLSSPVGDESSKILHKAVKRGSFLARGDESLARLAVHIKHTETTITARKNPGNFVFARVSPSVVTEAANRQKDVTESEEDSRTNEKARKRKPPAGTTPRTVKKAKIDDSRPAGKKLF